MSKKNLVLGGILAALIAGLALYQGPYQSFRERMDRVDNFLSGLDFAAVNTIEIDDGSEFVALSRTGDKWKISGTKEFYVKDEVINQLESALKQAAESEVEIVGENAGKKAGFGTNNEDSVKVSLKQGETVLYDLLIGKRGSDLESTYVSVPDSSLTYEFPADLNGAFSRSDWYNKTIFEGDVENVAKLRFQYPDREFTIERTEDGWQGSSPYVFEVDEDKIADIARTMASLRAVEIPEQTFEGTGLEKNLIIVEASGDDFSNTLMVGEPQIRDAESEEGESDALYYAKRSDSDNIYLISQAVRDSLDTSIRELR